MHRSNAPYSRQSGKLGIILAIVIALIAIAAGIYYFGLQSGNSNRYATEGKTELHGLVHWERSNIPATNIRLKLYQATESTENLLASTDVENAYYHFSEFDPSQPVFLRIFRLAADGEETMLWETAPVQVRRARAKYYPVYIPTDSERSGGGYGAELEGNIRVKSRKVYLSQGEAHRIRLTGRYLDELAKLRNHQVVAKGEYRDKTTFHVKTYYVIETQTGDRPMLGKLHISGKTANRKFVLKGEQDDQVLYVPVNYRLRKQLENNAGAVVLITGPEEQGAIKPLTLTIIKR